MRLMVRKILICWRDIPSQVVVQRGRAREKCMLSPRFQSAIDRAAMRAGKGSSDAYIAEWRRVSSVIDDEGDLGQLAVDEAAQLEAAYPDDLLQALIRSHGRADAASGGRE